MTQKDYERAAEIAQGFAEHTPAGNAVRAAFVSLFRGDNPRFNPERFLGACMPGANVRARTRYKVTTCEGVRA